MKPSDLPDSLWENSLVKRNHFYFHRSLQLISEAPKLDIKTGKVINSPFYREIKAVFTIDDLLDYFYQRMSIDLELINRKRDSGTFEYLINKYKAVKDIESLDIILIMIDLAEAAGKRYSKPIDIEQYNLVAIELIKRWQKDARPIGANRIIWRSEQWLRQLQKLQE